MKLGGTGFFEFEPTFGTGTFGGGVEFFKAWGSSDRGRGDAARRYSSRRRPHHVSIRPTSTRTDWRKPFSARPSRAACDKVLISTKATFVRERDPMMSALRAGT